MKCSNCMTEISADDVFCPNCGQRIAEETVIFIPSNAKAEKEEPVEEAVVTDEAVENNTVVEEVKEEVQAEVQELVKDDVEVEPEPVQGEVTFCTNCGSKVPGGAVFCENCGAPVNGEAAGNNVVVTGSDNTDGENAGKPKKKILPVIAGVAAAAVVVGAAAVVVPNLFSGGSANNTVMYITEEGMFAANLKKLKKDPAEYTDEVGGYSYAFSGMQMVSPDGKYKFYMEKASSDLSNYTLYYKKNEKADREKVDSDISRHAITADNKIVYIKDGDLYVSDMKEKGKVASNVNYFQMDDSGKYVVWNSWDSATYEHDLYYCEVSTDAEKEKIASGVKNYNYNTETNGLYYIKNDSLCFCSIGGEEEKLAKGADSIQDIDWKNNAVYYIKEENQIIPLKDYVEDDMAAADALITEPDIADYQHEEYVTGWWSSGWRTVTDYDSYNAACSEYYAKSDRDWMRDELEAQTIEDTRYDLYYYANGESDLVAEDIMFGDGGFAYVGTSDIDFPYPTFYRRYDMGEVEKMKLSEISYVSEVSDHFYSERWADEKTCIASAGKEYVLDLDENEYIYVDGQIDMVNGVLYSIVGSSDDDETTLYSIDLTAKNPGEMTELDDDVDMVCGAKNGYVYYIKEASYDNDAYAGELYCNGDEILSDVYAYETQITDDGKTIFCYTDYKDSSLMGTLVCVTDGEDTEVEDDVSAYYHLGDNRVLLLTEYTYGSGGDLKYYDGKETEKIDRSVHTVFTSNLKIE